MSLPKPQLRGLLAKRLMFHLPVAFVLSLTAAISYKYMISEPRKQAYADFYKNYDLEKEFIAMREAGVFNDIQPQGK